MKFWIPFLLFALALVHEASAIRDYLSHVLDAATIAASAK